MDVEIDALIKLMSELNAKSPKEGPGAYLITINDLVIKAAAVTLRRVPTVNASWTDDGMALFDDVDISVAVAIPDGLITPIIRQADQKGLATISREMKDLAGARARRQAEAGGIPGRRVLDLQHGHVRRDGVRRDHQSAAGRRSWRWPPGRSGRW